MINRLSFDLFSWIISFIKKPSKAPKAKTPRFSKTGFTIEDASNALPVVDATASEIAMLYATSATILSKATTCKSVFTKSPFAPVCLMVIIVDAGAVAAARADNTIENWKFK